MGPPASCGLSDHTALIVKPKSRQGTKSQTRKPIVTWDKRYNSVSSFGHFLMDVPWESVLDSDALSMFLSTRFSEHSVKIHHTNRSWLNSDLKCWIYERQKAFASGNTPWE